MSAAADRSPTSLPVTEAAARASVAAPDVVFVGGTGRSGTHIVAELLGRHSHYREVGIETRFHCNPRGFPDLLEGRVTLDDFVRKLRRFWWYRIKAGEPWPALLPRLPLGREVRGLHKVVPRDRFDAAVAEFERAYPDDPEAACRRLFFDLLAPLAADAGKPGLVEMSSDNVAQAPALLRVFPEARFVHAVRDGRDAGASKVAKRQKPEHPVDGFEGVEWWEARLRRIDGAVRELPPGKLLVLCLDELVEGDREGTYRALLEFAGIADEPAMREFFEREISAEAAHRGRWREGLSPVEQQQLTRGYEQALARLERDGIHCAELLRRATRRASGVASGTRPAPDRSS